MTELAFVLDELRQLRAEVAELQTQVSTRARPGRKVASRMSVADREAVAFVLEHLSPGVDFTAREAAMHLQALPGFAVVEHVIVQASPRRASTGIDLSACTE